MKWADFGYPDDCWSDIQIFSDEWRKWLSAYADEIRTSGVGHVAHLTAFTEVV